MEHDLTRFIQLTGHVGYYDNDYQLIEGAPGFARDHDKIWRAGLGVNWYINRSVFLGASYDRTTLNSNVPLDDYEVNRLWLVLGLER